MNSGSLPRYAPTGASNLEGSNTFHDFTVTLRRQENGFGFRIVGGTEEGSQVRSIFEFLIAYTFQRLLMYVICSRIHFLPSDVWKAEFKT